MSISQNIERAKTDYDAVYTAGKQAEYDAFWDGFQNYGNRTDYHYAFYWWAGAEEINPKHPITTTTLYQAFTDCQSLKKAPSNVVPIDSAFNGCYAAFARCRLLEEIPFDIPVTTGTDYGALNSTFYDCKKLKTVKLILDGKPYTYGYTFVYCQALENLIVEGEITSSGFNTQWSTQLNKPSITSIINALSTATSSLTVIFSKTAVNNAFATSADTGDGSTSAEWLALVATRSNWTISLV